MKSEEQRRLDEKDATTGIMEPGKNARRRMSATSSTTNDDEASTELLTTSIDKTHDDTSRSQSRFWKHVWGGDRSKWLWHLGLVFSVFMLITLSISSFEALFQFLTTSRISNAAHTESASHSDGQKQMLGIQLHPEDHASRAPKTITHHWNITSDYRSPDGVKKEVYLVNGEFPGPTIECRSGDRLVIHVTNNLSSGEGVSIHWHGLHMQNANFMDGAVGFTQCPVSNGTTFTYEFDVDESQSGTFWWHAHSQVQRGDGMYGGLVVHEPSAVDVEQSAESNEIEVLLLIGDWYHRSADEVLSWYMSTRGFGNEVGSYTDFL
jgi:FtsP/CotA-like multicopper oxidase with cupredoxin domain